MGDGVEPRTPDQPPQYPVPNKMACGKGNGPSRDKSTGTAISGVSDTFYEYVVPTSAIAASAVLLVVE